ncbi:hypothetical protein NL292_25830, partial [Klebsiella pneumoniae]|nr:hypothetical protein [Klebsiella pneumoniae]
MRDGHDNQFIEPLHLMSALLNQEGPPAFYRTARQRPARLRRSSSCFTTLVTFFTGISMMRST